VLKSGLIFGGLALVLGTASVLLSPVCLPCLAIFFGLGAGYLAGVFDKPVENRAATKLGTIAGAIGGVGALLGQLIGSAIKSSMMGPEKFASLLHQLGVPISSPGRVAASYYGGLVGITCCAGVLDVALMAGFGALGGLLWWQFSGKGTFLQNGKEQIS
jgi:hypothetical protein